MKKKGEKLTLFFIWDIMKMFLKGSEQVLTNEP